MNRALDDLFRKLVSDAGLAVDRVNEEIVSSEKCSLLALMDRVAVERSGADRPALFHARASAGMSGLLLGGENTMPDNRVRGARPARPCG